jgi:hypothetical protein
MINYSLGDLLAELAEGKPCSSLVKLWREYGRDRVTIGKEA